MRDDLSSAENRGFVAFATGLVALSLFVVGAPLSLVAAFAGIAIPAAWSWYELSFRGYTKTRWSAIVSSGLLLGVIFFVGLNVDPGWAGVLGVCLSIIHSQLYWSADEAKEYWLTEEERRELEAKRGRRR